MSYLGAITQRSSLTFRFCTYLFLVSPLSLLSCVYLPLNYRMSRFVDVVGFRPRAQSFTRTSRVHPLTALCFGFAALKRSVDKLWVSHPKFNQLQWFISYACNIIYTIPHSCQCCQEL
ncbi:hypothetical protein BJV78DRAFT_848409 [Lactifluus subvellereus]|nr:hypothetical protein BJV78DRAFT_848409 [Lactifluus subvellereus]